MRPLYRNSSDAHQESSVNREDPLRVDEIGCTMRSDCVSDSGFRFPLRPAHRSSDSLSGVMSVMQQRPELAQAQKSRQ